MTIENKEIFIPGPSGRIQAKYFKSKQTGAPIALVLQPHPQYGGTMNNRIVVEAYNSFYKNNSNFKSFVDKAIKDYKRNYASD